MLRVYVLAREYVDPSHRLGADKYIPHWPACRLFWSG